MLYCGCSRLLLPFIVINYHSHRKIHYSDMCAPVNCQRASSKKSKAKIFDYSLKELFGFPESDPDSNEGADVTFVIGQNIYHGHERRFSMLSEVLKKCFQSGNENIHSSAHDCILKVTRSKSSSSLKVFIDAPVDVFEAVYNFMLNLRLTVREELMPDVYFLSKCLQIPTLQSTCAEFLIHNLSISSVGVLCRFIQFNGVYQKNLESYSSETVLAKAVHDYLLQEADVIACSQTGILSARLIVNLTGNFHPSDNQDKIQEPSSEYLAFGVLRWAFEKLLVGERLARAGSEDNVYSDDEEIDENSNSHTVGSCVESRRKRAGSQFQFLAQINLLSGFHSKCNTSGEDNFVSEDDDDDGDANAEIVAEKRGSISGTSDPLLRCSTQDIRISVDINELLLCKKENGESNTNQNAHSLLTVCLTTGSEESETCLLAPTTLGVRSTSIWLGKLAGHLVSLSIKRCLPNHPSIQQLDQDLMHEIYQSRSRHQSRGSSISNSSSLPNDSNDLQDNGSHTPSCNETVCVELPTDEVSQTITADSAFNLARAISVSSTRELLSSDQLYQTEMLCISHNDDIGQDSPLHMLEARSGFGVGQLNCDLKHYIVIVGGYNRKGCLDNVELFIESSDINDVDEGSPVYPPVPGPRLKNQRGRLAVASSYLQSCSDFPDVVYACGGSTGSKDLASVDKLTCDALKSWLVNHEVTKNDHHDTFEDHVHTNGSRRNSDLRTRSDSTIQNHTSNRSSSLSNISFWLAIKSLHEARTNPIAIDFSSLQHGPLITNTKGSILVAGGVSGAQYLSSVEAYVADRDEWVYMPSMLQGRREACGSVLSTRNLIVAVGGVINPNSVYTSQSVTAEALDPRCANWFYIPSPLVNSIGQLSGASLTYCPNTRDNLLLVGGYNGHETLDTTWIFDPVAWKWRSGPNLLFARSSCGATLTSDKRYNLIFGGYNPSKFNNGFSDTIEMIF
ncbi:Kelch repeat and BTB domain-containing protein [Schistosoma japonicum]|nr:Kelch repeat and BTB domain-containing protein [Schistosoma japonicum]